MATTTIMTIGFFVFLAWLLIYRLFDKKIEAACERIRSTSLRKVVKGFLKVTYVLSVVAVVLIYAYRIFTMFSNKENKA